MDKDGDIDDIIDLTDTSESSSSSNPGVFEAHQPFVLELHDIRKDDPMPAENATPAAAAKIKKHKKKKKGQPTKESRTSVSSDSISEASSVAPSISEVKEEFYDAHESYHAIPENQGPVVAAARLQVHSETSQNPKATPPAPGLAAPSQQTTTSTARKEPSTITKPTLPPE